MRQRLKPSTISLQSYGGGKLHIVGQTLCQMSRGKYSVSAVLKVQKSALVDLLLGTDLQPHLGFPLKQYTEIIPGVDLGPFQGSDAGSEDASMELVEETKHGLSSDEKVSTEAELTVEKSSATVHLLKATRIPGRHGKVIHAEVDASLGTGNPILFEPDSCLCSEGLSMVDAVVEPDKDSAVTLLLENAGCQSVWLTEGQVLGRLETIQSVDPPEEEGVSGEENTWQYLLRIQKNQQIERKDCSLP